MPAFCTKCGSPLKPELKFCSTCGTPTAAPPNAPQPPIPSQPMPPQPEHASYQAASSEFQPVSTPFQQVGSPAQLPPTGQYQQPSYPPASYPPPPAYQSAPSQKSSGGGAVKVILIVVAVIFFLGILGIAGVAFTAWRVARAVHLDSSVSGDGGKVSINTDKGSFTANTDSSYSAEELGTAIYPGAKPVKGGIKMDTPEGSMVSGTFTTSDSKDAVLAFYKAKMVGATSVYDTGEGAVIQIAKGNAESIMVTISAKAADEDGKTQITIVHTKSTK